APRDVGDLAGARGTDDETAAQPVRDRAARAGDDAGRDRLHRQLAGLYALAAEEGADRARVARQLLRGLGRGLLPARDREAPDDVVGDDPLLGRPRHDDDVVAVAVADAVRDRVGADREGDGDERQSDEERKALTHGTIVTLSEHDQKVRAGAG